MNTFPNGVRQPHTALGLPQVTFDTRTYSSYRLLVSVANIMAFEAASFAYPNTNLQPHRTSANKHQGSS